MRDLVRLLLPALATLATASWLTACSSILGFDTLQAEGSDAGLDVASDAPADQGIEVANDAPDADQDVAAPDATCGDTQTAEDNCGRCGHNCQGGTCVGGMCQAYRLAAIHDGAVGIAVNETTVFAAVSLYNEIARVNKMTGLLEGIDNPVAILVPTRLALDGDAMYWTNNTGHTGSVTSCPLAGCGGKDAKVLADNQDSPGSVAVDSTSVYWAEWDGATVKKANRGDGSGMQVLIPASAGYQPARIVVRDGYVYVTEAAAGNVMRVATGGGDVEILGHSQKATGIAVDGTSVYWTDAQAYTGGVYRASVGGAGDAGAGTTSIASAQDFPNGIVVDENNVYWVTSSGTSAAEGTVRYCPLAGCPSGTPITLAEKVAYPIDVTADSTALYISVNGIDGVMDGAILKVAKP